MKREFKRDGFSNQIQQVIPEPIRKRTSRHILVSGLHPTDIGWYPQARQHFRMRPTGCGEHILILCMRGCGWFEIGGTRGSLQPNEALLIPAGTPHSYGASDDDPWSIHWLHFLGTEAPLFLTLLKHGHPVVPVSGALVSRLEHLFQETCKTLSDGFSQEGIICASQSVRHLLALLFFRNSSFHPRTKAPQTERIERTLQYLRERVEKPLTVAEMAREADLSETHFARRFRQHTGFSPMDYFIHLKMQRAARYLTLSNLQVKQIAAQLGYEDAYYFSRLFRKIMGTSPAEYRATKIGATG